MQNYVFGADIGGTSVKLGLFYSDGELLEKWEIPTRTVNGGVHVLPDVAQAIITAMERHGISASQVVGKVYIDDDMKAKMEAYLEQYGAKG